MTRDVSGVNPSARAVGSGSGSHIEPKVEQEAARGAKGPDELRREIERTRHELGDTVEELAGKMDVKGQALARVEDLRDKAGAMTVQLRSSATQARLAGTRKPWPVMVAGGTAAGLAATAGMAVLRRRGTH
ncbi:MULTISPECIES: DUF3618 domain-containing protein [Streptomyces]|uniref:DUF3618 domain-containing protein n=1 Tax=Streptomyces prasinus TaxID=67345 RepID=A0ABX6AT83_9ACTN|nr:DUF3618 domain-containing protein [Streptomyces prasinus]MCP3766130.1 DUF3618 domain-containing protein [Streptomyces sp. MAR25Y5]QEV05744.1 DUF3618 domain-containing protein [Streptomyces prasinus]